MADSRAERYAQQLDQLTSQAEELSAEARRRILALLDELNREVLAVLAHAGSGSYTAARAQMVKAQIDRLFEQFSEQASADLQKQEDSAYRKVALQVDTTVAAATGGVLVQPVIDRAALEVVQGYTADLVTGLSRDAAAKVTTAIQRGYLGQLNLTEMTAQIGRALGNGEFSGMFSPLAERAMSIGTNEVMRVQSLASVKRIDTMAARNPAIEKMWKHIPVARVPRIGHILADGQVRKSGEPFTVEGESLQYPRDPRGSPENTINCHCLVVPHVGEEYLKPTDAQRALLRSYGISVTAA
jgi:hypothetical protein